MMIKVYKNLFAAMLPQIINIAINLIIPAMIIVLYGSEFNGLISTVKQIVQYISLVGAGIATAATQALYYPVTNCQKDIVKGMMKAISKTFNRCGYLFVGIAIIISFIYPYCIQSNISYSVMVSMMLVVSLSGVAEFFVVGRYRSLLYAHQKVYVCTTIQAICLFVSLISAIIFIKMKLNIVVVQLAMSIVYLMQGICLKAYVKKFYKEYDDLKDVVPISTATEKRWDAMIHQLTGLAVLSSQVIILTALIGLEAASVYAVYSVVFSGLILICTNINNAITPFIGRSVALGIKDKLVREFNVVEYCFYIVCTLILSVSAVLIIPFISLYTNGADIDYIDIKFALLFVAFTAANIYRLPGVAAINASGHFKETKCRAIIEAFSCIIISVIATKYVGIYGVLLGSVISLGWRCIDIIIYSDLKIIGHSILTSFRRLFRGFLVIVGSYLTCSKIYLSIESYFDWLLTAIILSVIVFSIILLLNFVIEFKTAKDVFAYVFKRKG